MYLLYICIIYTLYMKVISLNIDEIIFNETEKIVALIKKPRNRYINEAIDFYNKHQQRAMLEKMLQRESEIVREDSMNILNDFEKIDYGD
jgi:predicted Holliday junction resolvase-like endonuclease